MFRTITFFLLIISAIYCYGAGMMDYFAIYEPWKMIDADDFPSFHQYQGERVIALFVIPSAVMTLFNILAAIWPPHFIPRKWLIAALVAYAFDWIFSFTMQIPIQLVLEQRKVTNLIDELLRTNWFRFAADTVHILIVLMMVCKVLLQVHAATQRRSVR